MTIFVAGQKSFGKEALKALLDAGHTITGVAVAPQLQHKDKMVGLALLKGIPICGDLERFVSDQVPDGTDLIVSAHSHWIISKPALAKCRYGGIGFHPSLLPRHRGQDAVRWTIHMKDPIAGGTIYRLTDECDGGEILLQKWIHVDPAWDHHALWQRLFPIGIEMLVEAVAKIEKGEDTWTPQNPAYATWEPSWARPRLLRNELPRLA